MKRRDFIAGVASAAALSVVARGQQSALPVIGILYSETLDDTTRETIGAFKKGLDDLGYFDGRNLTFEYRFAESHNDRLPALASEMVNHQVTMIYAIGTPAALAAKAATETVPIVFFNASDPVQIGLVPSLMSPGGNITGITNLGSGLTAKRLEMLHALVPAATSIAMLVNPDNAVSNSAVAEGRNAAEAFGIKLLVLGARNQQEIWSSIASVAEQRLGAPLVSADFSLSPTPNKSSSLRRTTEFQPAMSSACSR